jgi:hypothetical protein
MYTFQIHYKKRISPFGKIIEDLYNDTSLRISTKNYVPPFIYSLFYDRLFQIHTERPSIGNQPDSKTRFKYSVSNIGIIGSIEPFVKTAWMSYFSNSTNIIEIDPNINSDDEDTESEDSDDETCEYPIYDIVMIPPQSMFQDELKYIEYMLPKISPGGIILVEGIRSTISTNDYLIALAPLLCNFQDYYFADLKHDILNFIDTDQSTKVLVLIKKGPQFAVPVPKITIITPSCRPENIKKVRESIPIDWINQWFIIYDATRVSENPLFFIEDSTKIKECLYEGDGNTGNPQRNFALSKIKSDSSTYLYFLDDDNVFHPNLVKWLPFLDNESMYTFDQYNRIKGDNISLYNIDSAMVLIPWNQVKDERWIPDVYNADGHYIVKCFHTENEEKTQVVKPNWVYLNNDLCFYNYIV